MALWHRLRALWRNLARKRQVEDDLDAEIRSYQNMLEDEMARQGADPSAARRGALLEMGGTEQIKEEVRDVRLGATLEAIAADVRQSGRGLRRNPGMTVLGIVMLALGMGASTAVFSIFYAALVQPLPFRDMGRLVELSETRRSRGIDQAAFSEANFWDVRTRNASFEELAAYHYDEANLTGIGEAKRVTDIHVTAGFFRTLGVSPILGRDFAYDEDRNGYNNPVAILGNRFWKSQFGSDPNIVGKTLRLEAQGYTIVGVLPPGEPWLDEQIYTPFGYRADADRGSWEFAVIGRLRRGITADAARADLERIASSLSATYPEADKGIGFAVRPASTWIADNTTRRALWVLLGAVTFLLLIACVNVANLLLARGTARQREIAVRTALGAGRGRVVRFVMMESILLSGLGAGLGLVLADVALQAIERMEVSGVPRLMNANLNPWVVAFALAIAAVTGLLSGLAPALHAPTARIAGVLRDGDRQTGSRGQGRLRAALVAGEVALSFLLLVGAGLLIRNFSGLMNEKRGFQTENRLVFTVSLPGSYYGKAVGKEFLDRLIDRLSGLPQVVAVGAVSKRPLEGGDPGMSIDTNPVRQRTGNGPPPWVGWRVITPGYFRAVGLPILRGREFDQRDKTVWGTPGHPALDRHVILSARLARLLFGDEDAAGRHALLWVGQANLDAEVVGVVADSRERGLATDPALTVYLPYGGYGLPGDFAVHTSGNPLALVPTVRRMVAELDPDVPVADVRTFEQVVDRSVAPQRFNTMLLGVFSGLALLLATSGIYGVLSYAMSRRTPEIGLRVALGATRGDILALAIGQGMPPVMLGIVLGAGGAWWLSRYVAALLYGVKPFDLLTYFAVAALLMMTALAACYVPGHKAMRTDPAVALRAE